MGWFGMECQSCLQSNEVVRNSYTSYVTSIVRQQGSTHDLNMMLVSRMRSGAVVRSTDVLLLVVRTCHVFLIEVLVNTLLIIDDDSNSGFDNDLGTLLFVCAFALALAGRLSPLSAPGSLLFLGGLLWQFVCC